MPVPIGNVSTKSEFVEPCFRAPVPSVITMWVLLNVPEIGFTMVRSLLPRVKFPLVSVNVPLKVAAPFSVAPFALLIVRLFRANTLLGIFTPKEEPPTTRFEDEDVVRFVGVPAIEGPLRVSVFAPTARLPVVNVRVPLMIVFPHKVITPERFIVRLL